MKNTVGYEIDIAIQESGWLSALPDVEEICTSVCAATLNDRNIAAYAPEAQVSIVLGDDEMIHGLNKQYRNQDKPTNVLSFPCLELDPQNLSMIAKDAPITDGCIILGDVIVSLQTLKRETQEQGKTLQNHLTHMIIHGTLHLLGFDHINDEDAERMEQVEIAILAKLNIAN